MTLTAIDVEKRVYNPSVLLEQRILTEAELRVEMRQRVKEGLFCPHCYQSLGRMLLVTFVSPDERRKHFRHTEQIDGHKCSPQPESDEHLNAKAWIGAFLSRQPAIASVEVDRVWVEGEDGGKRKPDVLAVYKNGVKEAHEIQCSKIPAETLIARTQDLQASGHRVIWYLKRGTYTRQMRQWLWDNRIKHFFLDFEDELPSTREFTDPPAPADKPKTAERDNCTKGEAIARLEERQFTRDERSEREQRIAEGELYIGDRVTNARGWHGTTREIKLFDPTPNNEGGLYYMVWWIERENHEDKLVRKQPICGHLRSQIWRAE